MGSPGIGIGSKTKAEAEVKTKVTTDTDPIVQSEEIARYLGDDLREFVEKKNIDLAAYLHVSPESLLDTVNLIKRLCADIEQMLRRQLIRGVHLLLSDRVQDPNAAAETYKLTYHARYLIYQPERVLRPESEAPWGDRLLPPPDAAGGARFAVLIEWSPEATAQLRASVHWPDYLFNWVPEEAQYDASRLISYRFGGMMASGAEVKRVESSTPESLKNAARTRFA